MSEKANEVGNLFSAIKPEITLEEVFQAYYSCRRHKRSTINALDFELDYESKLIALWKDINNRTFKAGRSITFIVKQPVMREIFAADFRDRVVHHLIIRKLLPFFEHTFSPHSYSCRVGKGTLYGINDVYQSIKEVSENYTKECYVLKLDIQAFFMSINKKLLYKRLKALVDKYYCLPDKELLLFLIQQIVFHCPQQNCVRKGRKSDWHGLPATKSLFYAGEKRGIPIGNLTSQIFANFYLNSFDCFLKSLDKDLRFGRYVDDFVIIHKDKEFLASLPDRIKLFLKKDSFLTLHPNKFYLQSYRHGVPFIGSFIMPNRIYIGKRLKGNMFKKAFLCTRRTGTAPDSNEITENVAVFNSYLGFLKHHATLKIRKKLWIRLYDKLHKYVKCPYPYLKLEPYKPFSLQSCMRKRIKKAAYRNIRHRNLDKARISKVSNRNK